MPLGIPLPPPPPARPSRLSWPGPRRLPRTIMPSTAAGGGCGPAVATGPGARGRRRLFQAREGGAAASGLRPPAGRAGTMNQGTADSQRALLLGAGQPGKSLRRGRRRLHCCSRCSRRRLPGHGPAQPLEREGGRGSWELSFLPSVLSLKSNSLPRGGARARAVVAPRAGGLSCQPPGLLGGARGLREPRPRDGGPAWRWGDARPPRRISRLPGAEGVAGAGAAAAESVGAGGARRRAEAARHAAPRHARQALPASRAHCARPGGPAARPPAPRAPPPAAGDGGRAYRPGASSPRALRIGRFPPAAAAPAQKVPAGRRRPPAWAPASAIFFFFFFWPNLQLPSERERRRGRAGATERWETPPPPRSAPRSAPPARSPEAPRSRSGLAPAAAAAASREPRGTFCVASPPFV